MSNENSPSKRSIKEIEDGGQEIRATEKKKRLEESSSEAFSKMSVSSGSSSSSTPITPAFSQTSVSSESSSSSTPLTLTPDVLVEQFAKLQEQVRERINRIQYHLADNTNLANNSHLTNNLDDLLSYLSNIASSVPISRVGFYGRRGSGKTTLVNRLLGVDLLPTGDCESITATLTEVYGWLQQKYLAIIFYISEREWLTLIENAREDLKYLREQNNEDDLSPTIIQVLDQLTSLWGHDHDFLKQNENGVYAWEGQSSPLDLLPLEVRPLLETQHSTISEADVDRFIEKMALYTHRSNQIWPLVYKINVFGPFELLNQGAFSIVDIPGSEDGDESLGVRYKDGKRMCDKLFYLPNVDTLTTPETVKNCVNIENTFFTQFGVVLTHLDKIKHSFKCPTEEVINQFHTRIKKHLHHNSEKEFFYNLTSIYCLENGEKKSEYSQFFENFKNEVFLSRSLDISATKQVIHNYINEVNLAFTTLSGKVDFQPDLLDFTISAPNPHWKDEWSHKNWENPTPQNQKLVFPKHYTTLQYQLRFDASSFSSQIVSFICIKNRPLIFELSVLFTQQISEIIEQLQTKLKGFLAPVLFNEIQRSFETYRNKLPNEIHRSLISEVTEKIKDICKEELPQFRCTGKGCQPKMIKLTTAWWNEKAVNFTLTAKQFILDYADVLLNDAISDRQHWYNNFIERHKLSANFEKDSPIKELLQPFEVDPSRNPSLDDFVEARNNGASSSSKSKGKNKSNSNNNNNNIEIPTASKFEGLLTKHDDILSPLPRVIKSRPPKVGFVYVLSNQSFRDCIHKIGETEKRPDKRARELFKTGVPLPFETEKSWEVNDTKAFEGVMHKIFSKVRVYKLREFFSAPKQLIIDVGNCISSDFK